MKKIVVVLGMLLLVGAAAASAQTRWRVSVGFGHPRPYVSGFVTVGRPAPLVVYRPYWRFVFERAYVRHFYGRFRPYRPVRACWRHYRCGA